MIFDGDCGFCTSAVQWLQRRVEFVAEPWQFAPLEERGLTAEQASQQVWAIAPGVRIGGAAAAGWLLRRAYSRLWRCVGMMLTTPILAPLAALGYRIIARYRHRLPGGTPACRLGSR